MAACTRSREVDHRNRCRARRRSEQRARAEADPPRPRCDHGDVPELRRRIRSARRCSRGHYAIHVRADQPARGVLAIAGRRLDVDRRDPRRLGHASARDVRYVCQLLLRGSLGCDARHARDQRCRSALAGARGAAPRDRRTRPRPRDGVFRRSTSCSAARARTTSSSPMRGVAPALLGRAVGERLRDHRSRQQNGTVIDGVAVGKVVAPPARACASHGAVQLMPTNKALAIPPSANE